MTTTKELDLEDTIARAANLCNTVSVHLVEYLRSSKTQTSGVTVLAKNFLKLCDILSPIYCAVNDTPKGAQLPREIATDLTSNISKTVATLLAVDLLLSRLFARDRKKGITKLVSELSRGSIEAEIANLCRALESGHANLRISSLTLAWIIGGSPSPSILGGRLESLMRVLGMDMKIPDLPISETQTGTSAEQLSKSPGSRRIKHYTSAPSLSNFPVHARHSTQTPVEAASKTNEGYKFSPRSTSSRQGFSEMQLRDAEDSTAREELPRLELPGAIRMSLSSSAASPTVSKMRFLDQNQLASSNTSTVSLDDLDNMMTQASLRTASHLPARKQANEIVIGSQVVDSQYQGLTGNQSSLILALRRKQPQIVEAILSRGVDLSSITQQNLLTLAVINKDVACAQLLLRHGFNVNQVDEKYASALHAATQVESLELARLLIDHGADLNACNTTFPETVLSIAIRTGKYELTKLYLQHKADCNRILPNGETVLTCSINRTTLPDLIRLMLDYGANPDLKTVDGRTPLFHATTMGHTGAMRALLDKGAKPNLAGPKHPLWAAVHHPSALKLLLSNGSKAEMAPGLMELAVSINSLEAITILLDAGVSPNVKKDNVYTPLCTAIRDDRVDIVTLLLSRGADPNLTASEYPTFKCITHDRLHILPLLVSSGAQLNEPPGILEAAVASQSLSAVIYLLRNKVDVNTRTPQGQSALTTAIREGSVPIIDCLLNHGADPNMRGEDWPLAMAVKDPKILDRLLPFIRNPGKAVTGIMELAVKANQLESLKLLLKAGVNVEDKTGGVFSPLTTAIRENRVDIVEFLLTKGRADVNAAGEHLPLIKAIRSTTDSSDTRVIELLLEHGADINLLYRGWNAVMQAVEKGDAKILSLLIEKGNGVDLRILEPESGQTVFEIIKERGWHEGVALLFEHQQQTRMITSALQ